MKKEEDEEDSGIAGKLKDYQPYKPGPKLEESEIQRERETQERLRLLNEARARAVEASRQIREREEREREERERLQRLQPAMDGAENRIKLKVAEFLENDKKDLVDEVEELKKQLKQKYLSQKAIEEEKKKIAAKIFYFPSLKLVNEIKKKGKDYEIVLFKAIALKHGDLQEFKNANEAELKHITEHVLNWGSYFFDIKKLEEIATRKTGGMDEKKYEIDHYDLEITLKPKQSNSITVKYKGNVTSQHEFKETHLEKMAENRLREIATRMYYDFIKKDEFL